MNIASYIDHTYLKPVGTSEDIKKLCEEAKTYSFAAVCVNPTWIGLCKDLLEGTNVEIATVVGFPLGAMATESKVFETKDSIIKGATEIDMVMNIGKFLEGDYSYVEHDIHQVVSAVNSEKVKVIIETAYLESDQIVKACKIAVKAGAHYVKTSTGFASSGAKLEDVKLMRQTVGKGIGVKAAGGIKNKEDALAMIEAGASRLGASAGVQIVSS
jgi:deoxyribose-phosphate aldolase